MTTTPTSATPTRPTPTSVADVVAATDNGSAAISPVAVALNDCDVTVRDLTLRTPTLDDVFLELTGSHIEHDETEETGQ